MANLRDIAAHVGVSVSTVSRALTDHPHVREEVRLRVREVARELDYRPNALAQGLRRNQTRTVGLIVPDIQNDSHSSVTAVLQGLLQRFGYGLALYVSNNDAETERRCFEKLREQHVDGVVYVPCFPSRSGRLRELVQAAPVVEIFRYSGSDLVDIVTYDDDIGASRVVSHLLELGHRRIGVVVGPRGYSSTRRRLAGALAAVRDSSLPEDTLSIVHSDYTPDGGVEGAAHLFADGKDLTAIFAASSQFVVGSLIACRSRGMRVPEDVSVGGFGDPVWYQVVDPPVTAYAAPIAEIGMTAAQLLVSRMENVGGGPRRPAKIVISGQLIVRESTSALHA